MLIAWPLGSHAGAPFDLFEQAFVPEPSDSVICGNHPLASETPMVSNTLVASRARAEAARSAVIRKVR